MLVAESEDSVLPIELWNGLFGDEELRAVGSSSRGSGSGIRHCEEAGLIEGKGGVDLVLKEITRIAGTVTDAIAALDHKGGDNAVKRSAVVKRLTMHLLQRLGVGPVFGAFGETDEIRYRDRRLFFVELAGKTTHGRVDYCGRAGWYRRGLDLAGGAGGVGKLLSGGGRLCLRCCAEGENESENTKRHAGV